MNKLIATLAPGLAAVAVGLTAPAVHAADAASDRPGWKEFVACGKLPADKPVIKFNFRPKSKLADLVGFMSSLSCTPFLIPNTVDADRIFTLYGMRTLTPEKMYGLFLVALGESGLTIRPTPHALVLAAKN